MQKKHQSWCFRKIGKSGTWRKQKKIAFILRIEGAGKRASK